MPSAYEGTDIISYLHSKYIIRQRRISYRYSDISLKILMFYAKITKRDSGGVRIIVLLLVYRYSSF